MKSIVAFVALLLAARIFGIAASAWAAGTQAAPANVSLIGQTTLAEHLRAGPRNSFIALFNLHVENNQSTPISYFRRVKKGFNLSVTSDSAHSRSAPAPKIVALGMVKPAKSSKPAKSWKPARLTADGISTVRVRLTLYDADTNSVQVVLTVPGLASVPPSAETITLTRSPRSPTLFWVLLSSVLAGVAIAVLLALCALKWPQMPSGRARGWRQSIYADSTFSFSQSWATNLSAIFTAVAAVFAATGVLSDLVPGIDSGFFLALNLGFGVVLLLPAVVYSACQKVEDNMHVYGTYGGYILAASITGVAISGQLATVGAALWLSDLAGSYRKGLLIFLGVIYLLVVVYMEANRRQLWKLEKPVTPTSRTTPASGRPGQHDAEPEHTHEVMLASPVRVAALP